MSMFRYASARILMALLSLGLFALFLNALLLSQQIRMQSALLLAGPEPATMALDDLKSVALPPEVKLLARIDAAIDLSVPGGTGKVYLMADPQAQTGAPAQAVVYVAPADVAAFEAMVAETTKAELGGAPVIELGGRPAVPYWIDRIEQVAAETQRRLAPGTVFVEPFIYGRAAGLAPSVLTVLVPAGLFVLLACVLLTELRRIRKWRSALAAFAGLRVLDHEVEGIAAMASGLQAGDKKWNDVAHKRHELRQKRASLDACLHRGTAKGQGGWLWLVAVGCSGLASVVPNRPLVDALSTYLVGADLHAVVDLSVVSAWVAPLERLAFSPGDAVAWAVVGLLGPQSVGVAAEIRMLPVAVWLIALAMIGLGILRRIDARGRARGTEQ